MSLTAIIKFLSFSGWDNLEDFDFRTLECGCCHMQNHMGHSKNWMLLFVPATDIIKARLPGQFVSFQRV